MGYSSDQTIPGKYLPNLGNSKCDFYAEFLDSFRKISKHEGKQEAIKAFRDIINERIKLSRCQKVKNELMILLELMG